MMIRLKNIKVALMGPTVSIGDAFFFNCVRVIAAGIGIGLCAEGNLLGVLIFVLLYGGSVHSSGCRSLVSAENRLHDRTSFIDSISPLVYDFTDQGRGILGLSMVGAMVASMVNVKLAWTIQVGQTSSSKLTMLSTQSCRASCPSVWFSDSLH